MRHHRGRVDYKLRAQTVEPVLGQIKTCQKMTMIPAAALTPAAASGCPPPPPTTCASCTPTAAARKAEPGPLAEIRVTRR
jgi:hypothetical protein